MATLRTVTKNTLLYTLSSVLQRASSIIFFPIFSYYLTQGDYGIQSVVYFVTHFLLILCGLELMRTATRLIHESNDAGEDIEMRSKRIYGSYALVIFSLQLAMAALLWLIGPWLMQPFLNDVPFFPYIGLTLIALPFLSVYLLFRSYLQATHQGSRYFRIDITYFLLNVGLNLLLVAGFKLGILGLVLSPLISSVVFSAYAYVVFFRHTVLRFDKTVLRHGLAFSLPLVPFILAGLLIEWTDKMILNAKAGKEAAGILYIATMMAAFFSVLRESCNQALVPWFYQQYHAHPIAYIRRVIYAAFGGLAVVAVCISWFSFEILALLSSNPDLVEAYRYIPIIVNTALIVFLSQIFNMTVMYFKTNIRYLSLPTIGALPVSIGLSLLLIDRFGIYGATVTNYAAMATMTVLAGILSERSGFKMGYSFFIAVCAVSLGLSMLALLPLPYWPMLGMKITVALAMCVAYYVYLSKRFPVNAMIAERLVPVRALLQRVRG